MIPLLMRDRPTPQRPFIGPPDLASGMVLQTDGFSTLGTHSSKMMRISAIRDGIAALKDEKLKDVVAVFVGATSGIGLSTLEKTVTLFPNPTIHVVGRSETKFASQRSQLESVGPEANIIFHQGDITLLADVDKIDM